MINIQNSDIDFLINQFSAPAESKKIELPSEYAERVRTIPAGLSPFPGPFSYNRFPYFVEIVNLLSPMDPIKEIALMKGNQAGATTAVLETGILYNIETDPKAQLFITADAELAKTGMQLKIDSMIDGAGVRHLISSQIR